MRVHLVCPNPAVDRTILLATLHKAIPNRPLEVRDFPGGKSFNVAYALLREGRDAIDVTVHTMLGGENGERVRRLATDQGICVQAIQVEQNTRECNIVVDTTHREIYPIYEAGLELSASLLSQFTEQLLDAIQPGDMVVFSGSLMKGMPDSYIADLQAQLNDPSVKFIADTSGGALRATYEQGHPTLIKINDEEFNQLFENELESVEDFLVYLRDHVDPSIPYFIVTLGSKGSVARLEGVLYQIKTVPVEAKNPVASGDYFLGGLVRGLVTGLDYIEAIKRSTAYSTSNVNYWYPHIELSDIDVLVEQIEVIER